MCILRQDKFKWKNEGRMRIDYLIKDQVTIYHNIMNTPISKISQNTYYQI